MSSQISAHTARGPTPSTWRIGPRIEQVLATDTATWDEGLRLFLERSGYREETYHTFSCSPLSDDDGRTPGCCAWSSRRPIG